MRKRLRKKKRLGEFVEWGALLRAGLKLDSQEELDSFSDQFIEKVESLNCYCGGGISIDRGLDMVIELGLDKDGALKKLQDLEFWLSSQPCILNLEALGAKHSGKTDKIFDLWHEEPIGVEF
jgi:uncharacterized protein YggL (DUF469 family)